MLAYATFWLLRIQSRHLARERATIKAEIEELLRESFEARKTFYFVRHGGVLGSYTGIQCRIHKSLNFDTLDAWQDKLFPFTAHNKHPRMETNQTLECRFAISFYFMLDRRSRIYNSYHGLDVRSPFYIFV